MGVRRSCRWPCGHRRRWRIPFGGSGSRRNHHIDRAALAIDREGGKGPRATVTVLGQSGPQSQFGISRTPSRGYVDPVGKRISANVRGRDALVGLQES